MSNAASTIGNAAAAAASEPIAIIAMCGRFPGSNSVETLWQSLREGREAISVLSKEELATAGIDPAALSIPGFVNAAALLSDVDMFDAPFFGLSARDAELMDPQQRLFLECAWEAMEASGYDAERYPGSVGVFAGCDMSTYMYLIYGAMDQLGYVDGMQLAVGNDKDHLTTYASYKLNLRGPSVCVQTACSTSLVAVAVAVRSLLAGECDMALAGGVAVNVPQRKGYMYQPGGIVSPDGHCRTFDAAAQGTVIGSGVGVVALKRLSDALRDNDNIRAVIRGVGLNNDGAAKIGYHAPSIEGQAICIRMAHEMGGIDPETIGMIEAHGTATALGDPIEIAGLTQAFRQRTNRRQYCAIGSIKSNMGHLASAAGVVGLIKAALAVERGEIPPTLHYTRPNPQIDFATTPFYVAASLKAWPANGSTPRRAGVSSFGIGGTNAHVVLEEPPEKPEQSPSRAIQPILLSARSAAALEVATDRLAEWLRERPDSNIADVAFVLATGRKAFGHRRALLFGSNDVGGVVQTLALRDGAKVFDATPEARNRPVAMMFPGQGSQYPGMARTLYAGEPTFRDVIDHCATVLQPLLQMDLRTVLFPEGDDVDKASETLRQTAITQPALFGVEYALAALWLERGVVPAAMIGHSIGEWVAACLAGVIELDDALMLVAERGRLMQSMPPGAMLSVPLSETELYPLLQAGLSIAALNAPALSAVSGPEAAIAELERRMRDRGVLTRRLQTSHAFHSAMMDPIVPQFVSRVSQVALSAPRIPFISNVTGTWITATEVTDPAYWGRQLRSAVRFADGIAEVARSADCIYVEAGPGQTLGILAKQVLGPQMTVLSSLGSAKDDTSDEAHMLTAAVRLWLAGNDVAWGGVWRHERRRRLELPCYPFERQSYWVGPSERPLDEIVATQSDGRRDIADWFYQPIWTARAPTPLPRNTAAESWVVFDDDSSLAARLVDRLQAEGHEVMRVRKAERFDDSDPATITINPSLAEHYDALVAALGARRKLPRRVAHLWLLPPTPASSEGPDTLRQAQKHGFFAILRLVQALSRASHFQPISIGVIASGLAAPLGNEPISPSKAPTWAILKAIPQEMPHVTCRALDVRPETADTAEIERMVERIQAELTIEPAASLAAFRNGRRWVLGYEKMRIESPADPAPRLREQGVYVITGGLGNIALTFAQLIAERARGARLVLLGRMPVPAREEWPALAVDPSGGAQALRLSRLIALEAMGAEVVPLRADAADRTAMGNAMTEVRRRFGRIDGVIHAAGNVSTDFAPVAEIDEAVAESHLRPKADGLYVLAELLKEDRPEFVLVISSLSAVLAGISLGAYGAANHFLDSFCAARAQGDGGVPWIAADLDAWVFPSATQPRAAEAIHPEEGGELLLRILDRAPLNVVVSVTPLQPRIAQWVLREQEPTTTRSKGALHARPNLASQFVTPSTDTEKAIAQVWEQLLGVGPIGIHDRFFELGGHSLLAIQVIARLKEHFRIDIPVQKLFEAPTIGEFTTWINSALSQATSSQAADDKDALADALLQVESLSDEEVAKLLRQSAG